MSVPAPGANASSDEVLKRIMGEIPESQHHIIFHSEAELTIGDTHRRVVVIQTPHFLYAFDAGTMGSVLQKHVFEIGEVAEDGSAVSFVCRNKDRLSLSFSGSSANDFLKLFIRVYVGAADIKGILGELRVAPELRSKYHYGVGVLDPSQKFTFGYPAIASERNGKFYRDVSVYYHTCLENRKAFFELAEMPLVGTAGGDPPWIETMDLESVFTALKFSPFVIGCHVENVRLAALPTGWWSYFTGIKKYLVLKNLGVTSGGGDVVRYLKNARQGSNKIKSDMLFWDLSGNRIEDIVEFNKALRHIDIRAKGMVMERMHMNEPAMVALFQSLRANEHLHRVEEVRVAGSLVTKQVFKAFGKWCSELNRQDKVCLRVLSIGPVHNISRVMSKLKSVRLARILIYRTNIDNNGAAALAKWIKCNSNLNSLGLPGCTIRKKGLQKILKSVQGLDCIGLNLGDTELTGKKFAALLTALRGGLASKLTRLTLDRNPLTLQEFSQLSRLGCEMKRTKMLFLTGVVSPTWPDASQMLLDLIQPMEQLESLTLGGSGDNRLGAATIALIHGLIGNRTIKHVSLMSHEFGDAGLNAVAEFVRENHVVTRLEIDGSALTTIEPLQNYLRACAENKNLLEVRTPTVDIAAILKIPACSEHDTLTVHRLLAEMKQNLLTNRLSENILTSLAFRDDPVLRDLLRTDHAPALDLALDNHGRNWRMSQFLGIEKPFDAGDEPRQRATGQAQVDDAPAALEPETHPQPVETRQTAHEKQYTSDSDSSDSYSDVRIMKACLRSSVPDNILGDLYTV